LYPHGSPHSVIKRSDLFTTILSRYENIGNVIFIQMYLRYTRYGEPYHK